MIHLLKASLAEDCQQAAQQLAKGQLLVLPTETVYGLAADADNPKAVENIFQAKGRPLGHPLIVHLAEQKTDQNWKKVIDHYVQEIPAIAWPLIHRWWPGPLTLIFKRRPQVADQAAGHLPTIGLRSPSNLTAQKVLHWAYALGVMGVAAPSANRFGRISATGIDHAQQAFQEISHAYDFYMLDDGPCQVGIESTILDISGDEPVLLRPGMITRDQIEALLKRPVALAHEHSPKVSGTLASHYAPQAQVVLLSTQELIARLHQFDFSQKSIAIYAQSEIDLPSIAIKNGSIKELHKHLKMPKQAADCAHELFGVLHELDAHLTKEIWIERPSFLDASWEGVLDRLQRAAANR